MFQWLKEKVKQRLLIVFAITVEVQLLGLWLSGTPIIRIGLALRVNLSRILQN
jgi:hypothetical protein